MKIAVWNLPPIDLLVSGLTSGEHRDRFDVQKLRMADCERVLRDGHVDVALLPTLTVLKAHEDYDVLPAVAFSTWSYPFACLVIRHELNERIRNVAYNPDHEQERVLSEIILREHYRLEPEFVEVSGSTNVELSDCDTDASLLVGSDVPTMALKGRVLDLGQEWFELANYPMTWGLFATPKKSLAPEMIREVRDGILASELQRPIWIRAQETSGKLHDFYANDLRFRLDDLCVAGLTEFRQYLFYYDVVSEVRDVPFVFLPDEQGNEGRSPLL